jgi:acetate kinase
MKVLVINCGSSSIKYQLFDMTDESVLAKGLLERLGTSQVNLQHEGKSGKVEPKCSAKNHKDGLGLILESLVHPQYGVIENIEQIEVVGHRVVHGGEQFSGAVRIDEKVIKAIKDCARLAPLHNPPNLAGITAAQDDLPKAVQVAVFDTAFHSTLTKRAFVYALPYEWYEKYGVRRYGFHGTSHQYVAGRAAEMLGRPLKELNLITAHLGNGCSITAIRAGESVDHSMGLTPAEGLVMGTRGGDMDPAIIFHLAGKSGMSLEEIDEALQKKSGLLGISGLSNDMRDIIQAGKEGNERARLALEVFAYRLKKYIGAYTAVLGKVDALVFTGGIGENSVPVRQMAVEGLSGLGMLLDKKANETTQGRECKISTPDSAVKILVIPTNEELLIGRQSLEVAKTLAGAQP